MAAQLSRGASGTEAVAACLIGHQLPAAAAIAAACGDVRLATLLTQVPLSGSKSLCRSVGLSKDLIVMMVFDNKLNV